VKTITDQLPTMSLLHINWRYHQSLTVCHVYTRANWQTLSTVFSEIGLV